MQSIFNSQKHISLSNETYRGNQWLQHWKRKWIQSPSNVIWGRIIHIYFFQLLFWKLHWLRGVTQQVFVVVLNRILNVPNFDPLDIFAFKPFLFEHAKETFSILTGLCNIVESTATQYFDALLWMTLILTLRTFLHPTVLWIFACSER